MICRLTSGVLSSRTIIGLLPISFLMFVYICFIFLGAHILDYLLSHTSSSVYCIVRKDPSTTTEEKLMQKLNHYFDDKYSSLLNKRLFVITADLEKENLGLSMSKQEEISKKIDCVINSAAIVRHYGDYSEFEKINHTPTPIYKRLFKVMTITTLSSCAKRNNFAFFQWIFIDVCLNKILFR